MEGFYNHESHIFFGWGHIICTSFMPKKSQVTGGDCNKGEKYMMNVSTT